MWLGSPRFGLLAPYRQRMQNEPPSSEGKYYSLAVNLGLSWLAQGSTHTPWSAGGKAGFGGKKLAGPGLPPQDNREEVKHTGLRAFPERCAVWSAAQRKTWDFDFCNALLTLLAFDRQLVGRQDLTFRQGGSQRQPGKAMLGPPDHLHGAAHLNGGPEEKVCVFDRWLLDKSFIDCFKPICSLLRAGTRALAIIQACI